MAKRRDTVTMNRVGNGLLALGGFVLAALMVYSLAPEDRSSNLHSGAGGSQATDVAVFFPDREAWQVFKEGIAACVARDLVSRLQDADDAKVTVVTPKHARRIRFTWHDVRGVRETRDEVSRLLERSAPPIAVVGSSNSMLTIALAEQVRDSSRRVGRPGPIVLVPWATAVFADSSDPEAGPTMLLDLDRGRIFRFCPNNQAQAELVVSCLVHDDHRAVPDRVHVVADRNDPYAEDLAESFHRVVERRFKNVELLEHADKLNFPGLMNVPGFPGPLEDGLAESICRDAGSSGAGRETWVVLPLQQELAVRMLLALRRHARDLGGTAGARIQVLCGDAMGRETLAELARDCPFPVWCFSAHTPAPLARPIDPGASDGAQVAAEIVSALALCLDRPRNQPLDPDALGDALAALRLEPGDPAAFGRSLAFASSGERQLGDIGQVLAVRPRERAVVAFAKNTDGQWSAPVPIPSASVATRP